MLKIALCIGLVLRPLLAKVLLKNGIAFRNIYQFHNSFDTNANVASNVILSSQVGEWSASLYIFFFEHMLRMVFASIHKYIVASRKLAIFRFKSGANFKADSLEILYGCCYDFSLSGQFVL